MINFETLKKLLNNFCPNEKADKNDLVGVQVTQKNNNQIKKILITLDCTTKVIDQAIVNHVDLILTHHPFWWPGKIISLRNKTKKNNFLKLKKNKIAVYTLHTNYDELYLKQDLTNLVFPNIKSTNEIRFLSEITLPNQIKFKLILKKIKRIFALDFIDYFGNLNQDIKKISFAPGACGFLLEKAFQRKNNLFVVGEMKWSDWLVAKEKKFTIIELGHQSEEIFTKKMPFYLKKIMKNEGKNVKIEQYFHKKIKKSD